MKTHGFVKLILCAAVALVAVACSKKDGGGGASSAESDALYKQADTPDNLKGLLDTIVKAAEGGDAKKAGTLTRNLISDEAALKKALKDDAGEALKKLIEANAKLPAEPEKLAPMMKRGEADRTEIQVHGATTEEIAAGAPSAKEFPGGATDAAKAILRPRREVLRGGVREAGRGLGHEVPPVLLGRRALEDARPGLARAQVALALTPARRGTTSARARGSPSRPART